MIALSSDDGQDWRSATIFAFIAWTDYFDGIAARLTGQYSRLGALLDPLVDRLLVLSGAIVCWHFDLLPHWALALLGLRELFMLWLVRWGLRHGADIQVNWLGRRQSGRCSAVSSVPGRAREGGRDLLVRRARDGARIDRQVRPRRARLATLKDEVDDCYARLRMDTFPDLGSLSDQELKDLIQQLTDEEQEVSYRRRILHGKIDILRAELVNRLRKKHEGGEDVISGADVQRLTDILAGRASGGAEEL